MGFYFLCAIRAWQNNSVSIRALLCRLFIRTLQSLSGLPQLTAKDVTKRWDFIKKTRTEFRISVFVKRKQNTWQKKTLAWLRNLESFDSCRFYYSAKDHELMNSRHVICSEPRAHFSANMLVYTYIIF